MKLSQINWESLSDYEKSRRFTEGFERMEIEPSDLEGKSPEQIEQLQKELQVYKKWKEQRKLEIGRLREDKIQENRVRGSLESQSADNDALAGDAFFGYYGRQMTDRMEHVNFGRAKNPLKQEPISSSSFPYPFYAEVAPWKDPSRIFSVCASPVGAVNYREDMYLSKYAQTRLKAKDDWQRKKLLRRHYLSCENLVNSMPVQVQPFLRLSRVDKPIGSQLLFVPGFLSILAGTPYGIFPDAMLVTKFAAGTLLTRGAGCTINDIWDRKLDARVQRCKDRPLASGQVSVQAAQAWFVAQMLTAFSILLTLPETAIYVGLASVIPIIVYPTMKRLTVTNTSLSYAPISLLAKPQVFLGLTFNMGAFMGFAACTNTINWNVCLPLYTSMVLWTLVYDTVYAKQDLIDDKKLKLNSMADMRYIIIQTPMKPEFI